MGIYRGAGGSGDATADASSEASLIRVLAVEVQADADAAQASANSADASATAAATSATNAANSATAAEDSATSASGSASSATSSASAASTSASNAASSATAAQTAETNAETAETNATTSASLAQDWAIKTTGAVSGGEYSSKYHAQQSASSASAASTSASNAATSATNSSNSATAAATSATNAASSATSASGSASTATTQASNASTSATNAASSATSAAGSATTATTQAGLASASATAADASADAAAISETNAASSASAASTSASAASTSATNAANSATSAGTSATNAAASAAAAAASYDSFDDRYLGVKTAAPTLDNDGNALVTGALYYNDGTVTPADKGMWVYDGSQWIAASAASTAILTVFKYTATAAQTTFTGADDNSVTLTYTVGSVIITVNGAVMEVGTDVTATTGTSIVLSQAALAGDEVNIYAFATFNIANTYTQAQADAAFLPKSNPSYTGTLTGGTGVVNLGSGQFYKDASGNVGIGTSSPSYKLHVNSATNSTVIGIQNTSSTYQQNLFNGDLYHDFSSAATVAWRNKASFGESMRIDSAGNVGIGTSSPQAKLDVIYTSSSSGGSNTNTLRSGFSLNGVGTTQPVSAFRFTGTYFAGIGGVNYANQWVTDSVNALTTEILNTGATPIIFGNSGTERMRISSGGRLLLGTTNEAYAGITARQTIAFAGGGNEYGLAFRPDANTTTAIYFSNAAGSAVGSVTLTATTTAYVTSSDYRLKENIAPMTGALDTVSALKPVTYNWKEDGSSGQGFIAHELQEVVPECVTGEKDAVDEDGKPKYQGIDTSFLVATLTAAIQELKEIVDTQSARIAALEGTN